MDVPFLWNMFQVCCGIVEERGLTSVGIYRVPGNSAAVMALTEQVNTTETLIFMLTQNNFFTRGGCNLECGKLANGKSEKSNGKLEFSLENGYLENGVGN